MMDEQINIPFIIILLETKYLISFQLLRPKFD